MSAVISCVGEILYPDCPVRNGLANEVESNVDVFGASVIVVVRRKVDSGLVVAVKCGGCRDVAEELCGESAKPNAFFCSVCCGNVLSFGCVRDARVGRVECVECNRECAQPKWQTQSAI